MMQDMSTDVMEDYCLVFDPLPWEEKFFEWNKKKFIKDHEFTLLYIPINFDAVIQSLNKKMKNSGAINPDGICLVDHSSMWNVGFYISVDREVEDIENMTLSGKFFSKVYEGSYDDTEKWTNDFREYARGKGIIIEKVYVWYTTYPDCARIYGKNYVVLIGKIAEEIPK